MPAPDTAIEVAFPMLGDSEGEMLSEVRLEEAKSWLLQRPDDIPASFIGLIDRSEAHRKRMAELELELKGRIEERYRSLAEGQMSGIPGAEDEIRRSEERYRSLVQGGAQLIWVRRRTAR